MGDLKDTLPPTQVIAIGYDIVGAISDNAQITFHHAFAEDDPNADAKFDKIMAYIDRQRARYEAPKLKDELADLVDKLALVDGDAEQSEINYNKAQAELDVQIEEFGKQASLAHDEGYTRHRVSGRNGAYTPKGSDAQRIAAAEAGARQAIEAKVRNEAERNLFLSNINTNKDRMAGRIEHLKAKLAGIEKLVT